MAQSQGGNGRLTASIVVLTYNRRAALEACLNRIEEHTTAPADIIVVDNGSDDDTSGFLARWVRQIPAPQERTFIEVGANEGVCARNRGVMVARGTFILQVDDDVLVAPGWDKYLLDPFSDPHVGAVGQEGFFINWAGLLAGPWTEPNFLDERRPEPGEFCDLVMGYCWAWRNIRDWGSGPANPIFLYDQRFSPHWHEETDLQLQIKFAGYRIRCGPAVAQHRSMKSWDAAHGDDAMVGLQHAADHERLLIEKWGDKRALLRLELDQRGQGN